MSTRLVQASLEDLIPGKSCDPEEGEDGGGTARKQGRTQGGAQRKLEKSLSSSPGP